jgi:hypothetical protein
MTAHRRPTRLVGALFLSFGALLTAALGAARPAGAAPSLPQLPQPTPARSAAQWLAGKLTPQGFIPQSGSSNPDLSATAQTVLALNAANVDPKGAATALDYLEAHLDDYVSNSGADGPGQLAQLILDAVALGVDPSSFGGSDLVTRLLATQQSSGPDAGLFGSETQAADFAAGNYQQGLALVALAAVGVRGTPQTTAAVQWLAAEQCPDGGWTSPDNANNACSGTPATFSGPDTNSTALALQGLTAQSGSSPAVAAALAFLTAGQDPDGGWSFYPNTVATPGVTDPDSTALVVQGLAAVHAVLGSFTTNGGTANPVQSLLSFQLTSGTDSGAFYFPPAPSPANVIATYQAVPALVGLPFGWGPSGTGYWEVAADGGIFSYGPAAGFLGSAGAIRLNRPVVGMASTPGGDGYWEAASDGGIFSYGSADYDGSMGGTPLNQPVVGMAAAPDGRGYWEVAADGGLFAFGDAGYYGSMGGTHLNQPVVGVAATPDGRGYWEVAADGGLFAFGDAGFHGSMGGNHLNQPVVGMTATADGDGYWEVAADGGLFAFGDAGFHGSMGGTRINKPVVGMAATPDGNGYWEVASDGGIFNFGDATFFGSAGATPLNAPVVGIAASPARPT